MLLGNTMHGLNRNISGDLAILYPGETQVTKKVNRDPRKKDV